MTKSLQGRMMLALVLSITLCWALALTSMFAYTASSQSSIWDNKLQSIATKILITIPAERDGDEEMKPGRGLELRSDGVFDDEKLAFQVWAGKVQLVAKTPNAPETPLQPNFTEGFTESDVAGIIWRTYSVSDRSGQIYVQVGYPRSVINQSFHTEALIALGLSTLLLVLVGLLMWWAVRKSLQPIVSIEKAIRNRQKFDLAPLPLAELPTEVRPLVHSFNHLMDQLDQAVQGERRFIGDAAHELRTPLSALHAQTEVALRASTLEDKDAALVKLLTVVERSTRLSEQLLDKARLDAGVHAPIRQWYDLDDITAHVASEFEVSAQKSGKTIRFDTQPCQIQCDVDEIGILLRNLVDNALRYTGPNGQIKIKCSQRSVGSGSSPYLEVSDDGPGVPEEEQTTIFDRFHRVPGTGPRGSGIGLSLVAKIASLHEATIETCNGIGSPGFCVRIVFPVQMASSSAR